jgi:uncharacterized repeat protein (TIGR01451 family)
MRRAVRISVSVAVLAAAVIGPSSAMAQAPSPPGCSANQLHLDPDGKPIVVRPGDVIDYTLSLDNVGPSACDVNNVNVTLQLPTRSGEPSPVKESKIAFGAMSAQYPLVPLGIPKLILGPYKWTVDVDPGVRIVRMRTAVEGAQLQDAARSPVNIDKGVSSVVFTPSITIDKVGSITGPAPAPQTVTYTFYVRNGSDPLIDPAATALSNVTVTDDKCGNPTYVNGDTNGSGKLEISETWAFQCTLTHPAPGTYTNVAVANGENVLNNRPVPVVSPPDNWTVVLTAPPAPAPQGGVLPVNAAQAPCDIVSPSGVRVRAREQTTIRVRVRNVDRGSTATITLPGGKKVSAKTNSSGIATFKVRPTKTGRATIRMAECGDVARFSVSPARKTQTRRAPRVTG